MDCSTEPHNIIVDVHVTGETPEDARAELRAGLLATPRTLPTKYLYDDRGSELFEGICELPEYYQTRTERQLLIDCADQIVDLPILIDDRNRKVKISNHRICNVKFVRRINKQICPSLRSFQQTFC